MAVFSSIAAWWEKVKEIEPWSRLRVNGEDIMVWSKNFSKTLATAITIITRITSYLIAP
jgi:hypothetical protein